MSERDERALDALMRQVGLELVRNHDALSEQGEAFLQWLAADLREGAAQAERARDAAAAAAFATRVARVQQLSRAEARVPRRVLRRREAPVVASASRAIPLARREGCAAMLDLAAAAGAGRELWDEPCESWLELPPEMQRGQLVALGVAGDSMAPVLDGRDVILVRMDASPAVDDIVLARVAGDGVVVKRLARQTADGIELASFNAQFSPIVGRRGEITLLGVVVARVTRVD